MSDLGLPKILSQALLWKVEHEVPEALSGLWFNGRAGLTKRSQYWGSSSTNEAVKLN